MPLVFMAISIAAGLYLPRARALVVIGLAWIGSAAMVAWGPANDAAIEPGTASFWVPWTIVLLLGVAAGLGLRWRKDRRRARGLGRPDVWDPEVVEPDG